MSFYIKEKSSSVATQKYIVQKPSKSNDQQQ